MYGMNGWNKEIPGGDLISRAAAIDDLHGKDPSQIWDTADIEVWVNALPSAQPTEADIQRMQDIEQPMLDKAYECGKQDAMQWIPCKERLPKEGQIVLATHLGGLDPSRQVIEHIYSDGKFLRGWDMDMNVDSPTFGQRYMGEVIAWMPLPEPYREDENE